MLKLVSFERLARNDFCEWGMQAEAHCERNLNHHLWRIRHNFNGIVVQGIFLGIFTKISAASLKVTGLLFAFAFCKKWTRKTVVLARWLFVNLDY